jgi:hypothetical protein
MRSKCQKIYQHELCSIVVKLCIQYVWSSNDYDNLPVQHPQLTGWCFPTICIPELDVCISQHQAFWLEVMLLTEVKTLVLFPFPKALKTEWLPLLSVLGVLILEDLIEGRLSMHSPPRCYDSNNCKVARKCACEISLIGWYPRIGSISECSSYEYTATW